MGEKIGYARVSTREQNLSSQVDALNNAGCIRIFTDKISVQKTEQTVTAKTAMLLQFRRGKVNVFFLNYHLLR